MEIPALQGLKLDPSLMTKERPLRLREEHKELRIGVPREISNEERRVALAPSGITALVASGHKVYVETRAGEQAHFTDDQYSEAGAMIATGPRRRSMGKSVGTVGGTASPSAASEAM